MFIFKRKFEFQEANVTHILWPFLLNNAKDINRSLQTSVVESEREGDRQTDRQGERKEEEEGKRERSGREEEEEGKRESGRCATQKGTGPQQYVANVFCIHITSLEQKILKFYLIIIKVFPNGPGDLGSIPGRVIPKTQKMVLDASLLNTQHYKVRIKGKLEQSRGRSSALLYIV